MSSVDCLPVAQQRAATVNKRRRQDFTYPPSAFSSFFPMPKWRLLTTRKEKGRKEGIDRSTEVRADCCALDDEDEG